jgi:hypothetical protein
MQTPAHKWCWLRWGHEWHPIASMTGDDRCLQLISDRFQSIRPQAIWDRIRLIFNCAVFGAGAIGFPEWGRSASQPFLNLTADGLLSFYRYWVIKQIQ